MDVAAMQPEWEDRLAELDGTINVPLRSQPAKRSSQVLVFALKAVERTALVTSALRGH
jgi:hypothetical protein